MLTRSEGFASTANKTRKGIIPVQQYGKIFCMMGRADPELGVHETAHAAGDLLGWYLFWDHDLKFSENLNWVKM